MMYSVEVTVNDVIHVDADSVEDAYEKAADKAVEIFDVDPIQVTTSNAQEIN